MPYITEHATKQHKNTYIDMGLTEVTTDTNYTTDRN